MVNARRFGPSVERYVADINRHRLLTPQEEYDLALKVYEDNDVSAFNELARANLRFVVKVAHEYTGYGLPLLDLIQEGNAGRLKALEKFDPYKGFRLISYGGWWIRAYIQNYVMRSWSMVRIGTTQAQRKLFFKLRSERDRVEQECAGESGSGTVVELAERLNVAEKDIIEMNGRLSGRDASLDAPVGDAARTTYVEFLREDSESPEELYSEIERRRLLRREVNEIMKGFNDRERFIVAKRLMADEPMTLQKIGKRFSISRERVRQIEGRVLEKLRAGLSGSELDCAAA